MAKYRIQISTKGGGVATREFNEWAKAWKGSRFGEVCKTLTELSTLWPREIHMTIDVQRNLWFEQSSGRKTQNRYLDGRRTFRMPFL